MKFKPFTTLLIILFFQSIASCTNKSGSTVNSFKDSFISFSFPENWIVSEIDSSNKNVRIYILEKQTDDANSTVLNLIINFDAKKQTAFYLQTEMINQTYDQVSFSEADEIEFLNKPTIMSTYSFERTIEYVGANFSLQCNDNVLGINYQFSKDEQEESFKEINSIINTIDLSYISK